MGQSPSATQHCASGGHWVVVVVVDVVVVVGGTHDPSAVGRATLNSAAPRFVTVPVVKATL